METIFAAATAPGAAAIAVVRISGPCAHVVVEALAGRVNADRRLVLRTLRCFGETLDQALVVCFPASSSVTGELYAELHVHGGKAVVRSVINALASFQGCRIAEPGEFSRRAMATGKMDLTQLEGVADLVAAETEGQRRQALRLIGGEANREVSLWRTKLIELRALNEAVIDFPDEDLPAGLADEIRAASEALRLSLTWSLASAESAVALREGVEVVLVGPPNVGKSSLLNAIAGRRVALTSPVPGTTRDMVECRVELDGMAVTFVDTAGDRAVEDTLEAEGIGMGRQRAASADLILRVASPDIGGSVSPVAANELLVWNKADLAIGPGLPVSAETGFGMESLLRAVAARLVSRCDGAGPFSRQRHREWLGRAVEALTGLPDLPVEVAADRLREASLALDVLVGRIDTEDVLDKVFGKFCIGK